MKKIAFLISVSLAALSFTSCSKKDCVCTDTYKIDGVVQSTSSSSGSGSASPAPVNSAGDSGICDSGDYFSSSTNSQGQLEEYRTECELE